MELEFRGTRTTLVGQGGSTYNEHQDHTLITVDERLDTPGMLVELSALTTRMARIRWQPPEQMRGGPNAIRFYECDKVRQKTVEYEIIGLDLHYRLRPGLDPDTALRAIMEAITEAAAVQGWQPLAPDHRAVG